MNSPIINRIRGVLEGQFRQFIDLSDWQKAPKDHQDNAFLSRSLAALCIKDLAKTDHKNAAYAVVDGMDDCGIDAIHFDSVADVLYLVQSKWTASGNTSFEEGAAAKFVNGIKALLAADFDRFNEKVRQKAPDIREALYSSRDVKIRVITVHTAKQAIAPHVKRVIQDLVKELNDPIPIAEHLDLDLTAVYELVTAESKDPKITIQAVLNDWGVIETPYLAYYGRVPIETIVDWWTNHRNRLFTQNLRLFYQSSTVNDALRRTLSEEWEHFWYYNNGITIIADKVVKGIAGAPAHKFANFTCIGASVVNGAQTVGTIGTNSERVDIAPPADGRAVWVQVRLISLESCPPDFGRRITRAANLQNAVGNREFAAMDPLQHRLAVEFALDKRRYVYKSGEFDPHGEDGCSIAEATQALASAHSVGLAVLVKRNIGLLWADTEQPPYTEIFHKNLSSDHVWRSVRVLRSVDEEVRRSRMTDLPRADLLATHMQRVILHLVFQDPDVRLGVNGVGTIDDLLVIVPSRTRKIFEQVAGYIQRVHPNDYLANFSKNTDKCEDLVTAYTAALQPPIEKGQMNLFPEESGSPVG